MNPTYMILVYLVWFLATYFVVTLILVLIANRKNLYENRIFDDAATLPFVSIVISAYNEEQKIEDTLKSLKKIDYNKIEFIIVNDGSNDKTSDVARKYLDDKRFILIDNSNNKGKAACLNQGIKIAKGEFIATMDADSMASPDIIKRTLPYFDEHAIGAVTVSVEARNPSTFLQRIIDLEYIIGLSLFLKLLSTFNCLFVTPGPFSIYRSSVLRKIDGFDEDNITEDMEIAFRIHKSGYKIKSCIDTKVRTLLPDDFKSLYRQRKRWYSGAIKTYYQHREMLFNRKFGYFGFFIPFNIILITLGIVLFLYSTYLGLSKLIENIYYYHYTNYNFFENFLDWNFDILTYGGVSVLSFTAFLGTLLIMFVGLKYARIRYKEKKIGMLGYPFIFFLYQIFWVASYFSVIRGKKVKWR
ncbi:glycosyltransferase family 2 protein [Candidatus Woesearchaeota archaeon]|nr:glycosyltransferase family 2 protein [Candidatus Woesearchaeota archaeon]